MGNPSIPPRNLYHQFILTEPQKGRRIQSTIEQGRTLLENSQYDEARRLFLQTLSSCPYAIPALNNLAFISLRESDNTRALNIIDEVLRIDPEEPIAHAMATQCWYHLESDPMVRYHSEACLKGYLKLVDLGDPVDPNYSERAFPFVLQALLIAEDDAGIVRLYEKLPDRAWTPTELTWVGVAHFNRGHINAAHLIWRRAGRTTKFEPARIYATLAQHVLSDEVLPFSLDYDILISDDDGFAPYPASTLSLAAALNKVFRSSSLTAQESLVLLMQSELPGHEFFLVRLAQNPRVTPGVRMTAALHLLWANDSVELARKLLADFSEETLDAVDRPVFHLLRAAIRFFEGDENSPEVRRLVEEACQEAKAVGLKWVVEYAEELFESEETFDPLLGDLHFAFESEWSEDELFVGFTPLEEDEPEHTHTSEAEEPKNKKGHKPSKGEKR